MAKVIITCGKICCGKTTYAKKLCARMPAVLLSVDEAMLGIFGNDVGEKHEECTKLIKTYLKKKAVETVCNGINVVMDWGLWTKTERKEIRSYFKANNAECAIHYLEIEDGEWMRRIVKRNGDLSSSGVNDAYFVDNGLLEKCRMIFEKPEEDEIDVLLKCKKEGF